VKSEKGDVSVSQTRRVLTAKSSQDCDNNDHGKVMMVKSRDDSGVMVRLRDDSEVKGQWRCHDKVKERTTMARLIWIRSQHDSDTILD